MNERGRGQTVRLLNAWMFGLVALETLESLRLTASEGFDTNCWEGRAAIFEKKANVFFLGGGLDGQEGERGW